MAEPETTTRTLQDYRLDQLQLAMQAINSQLAALSTQVMTLQTSLPDRYLTRLEFSEILRQKELQQQVIDQRLDRIEGHNARQDEALKDLEARWDGRGWGVAGALATALVALGVGAIGLIEKLGGH